jgi:hypothetical protein
MTVHLSTLQLGQGKRPLVLYCSALSACSTRCRLAGCHVDDKAGAFGSFFGLEECEDYRAICLRSTDSLSALAAVKMPTEMKFSFIVSHSAGSPPSDLVGNPLRDL